MRSRYRSQGRGPASLGTATCPNNNRRRPELGRELRRSPATGHDSGNVGHSSATTIHSVFLPLDHLPKIHAAPACFRTPLSALRPCANRVGSKLRGKQIEKLRVDILHVVVVLVRCITGASWHGASVPQLPPEASFNAGSVPLTLPAVLSADTQTTPLHFPTVCRAPQHPASHVFQTIPPRAPSRSSRSTILSYTLHLATSARLAAYTAPNGARDLLQQAESSGTRRSPSNVDVDLDFLETELKAQGMWKLGAALLKSSNRGAIAGISDSTHSAMDGTPTALLPPAVERRAALASLIENLLVDASAGVPGEASDNGGRTGSGAGEDLASPSQAKVVIVASDQLDSINALKPLTSPDTTTLYHSTTTSTTPLPAALDGKGTGSASDITKTGTAGEHRGSTSNTVASGSGVHAGLAGRASIAQSLIDLKFGGGGGSAAESGAAPKGDGADRDTTSMSLDKDVKPSREAETVFGAVSSSAGVGRVDSDPATAASGGLHTTPHMDYRIVRGQAMRSRARTIYAQSVLVPEGSTSSNTASAWCRRHRVVSCSVCRAVAQLSRKLDRRTLNLPGQGLREEMSRGGAPGRGGMQDGKKLRLVELVPDFLDLSAELLRDQHEKIIAANGAGVKHESDRDDSVSATTTMMNAGTEWTPTPGPAWYALLHSLVIQAVLEGYLVDGWTGTGGLETLLGVGCGVWEGRGWDTRMIVEEREELERVAAAVEAGRKGKSDQRGGQDGAGQGANVVQKEENEDDDEQSDDDEEDDEEEDDDDDDVEAERARERHEAKRKLIDAARALFGSRDAAQAEFELSMRDRTHEVSRGGW